ncbi:MAG: hypothetical protein ACI843_002169 [Psychrobacter glaciei]|jgi:hypothetical protein
MPLIYTLLLLLISCSLMAQENVEEKATEPVNQSLEGNPAETTPVVALTRVPTNPAKRRVQEAVQYLRLLQREGEAVKATNEGSNISGLYLPENTGKPQGGILILHGIEQHAHWPDTVAPLREYLPDYGWSTLSLFFDNYLKKPLPEVVNMFEQDEEAVKAEPVDIEKIEAEKPITVAATNEREDQDILEEDTTIEDENFNPDGITDALDQAAENFEASAVPAENEIASLSEDSTIDPQQAFITDMYEQVEGGLQQLNTLGQFNLVIIAHGLSANWAVKTLQERMAVNTNTGGYSLILVNAKSSVYPEYALNDELAKLEIPILDIYTENAPEAMKDITARRNTVVRQQKSSYTQIRLPAIKTIYSGKQNMVSRRVRGWLKTHAAGEVIAVE